MEAPEASEGPYGPECSSQEQLFDEPGAFLDDGESSQDVIDSGARECNRPEVEDRFTRKSAVLMAKPNAFRAFMEAICDSDGPVKGQGRKRKRRLKVPRGRDSPISGAEASAPVLSTHEHGDLIQQRHRKIHRRIGIEAEEEAEEEAEGGPLSTVASGVSHGPRQDCTGASLDIIAKSVSDLNCWWHTWTLDGAFVKTRF